MKRLFIIAIAISFLFISVISAFAANDKDVFLVHLKTSLKKDDAQICVAYNIMWAEKVAWDIYLFYKPFAKWMDTQPKPANWMHQLTDDWATKDKYRTGDDLKNELFLSMKKLVNNHP